MSRGLPLVLSLLLAPLPLAAAEPAPGCDTFSWDVSHELTALAASPAQIVAGDGKQAAPLLRLETLYTARLAPQAGVVLAARPGKPMLEDDAFAGLLNFRVPQAGRYRVSITTGHWLDVVDGNQVIPSLDFQGRRGCPLVHKIVEFDLPSGRDLTLQLAGNTAAQVGVLITAVARKP